MHYAAVNFLFLRAATLRQEIVTAAYAFPVFIQGGTGRGFEFGFGLPRRVDGAIGIADPLHLEMEATSLLLLMAQYLEDAVFLRKL